MANEIPIIVEQLYHGMLPGPTPEFWPDYLKNEPITGHGLWCFYRGLQLGLQIGDACFDRR